MQEKIELFKQILEIKGVSENTKFNYVAQLKKFLRMYSKYSLEDGVKRYLARNKNFLHRAFIKNYLEALGRQDIIIPKLTGSKPKRINRALSDDEVKRLRYALYQGAGSMYGLLFDITLGAGLRREEVISLIPNDFQWSVWVKDTSKPLYFVVKGKGNKDRLMYIKPEIARKLHKYIMVKDIDLDKRIFQITSYSFWRKLRDYSLALFGPGKRVRTHALRKTKATNLLNKGVDVIDIKNFLGHSSISTTERYLQREEKDSLLNIQQLDND